jgi:hypothetical protein
MNIQDLIFRSGARSATPATRKLLCCVILQGETVFYSYGKCPRYIVAIAYTPTVYRRIRVTCWPVHHRLVAR